MIYPFQLLSLFEMPIKQRQIASMSDQFPSISSVAVDNNSFSSSSSSVLHGGDYLRPQSKNEMGRSRGGGTVESCRHGNDDTFEQQNDGQQHNGGNGPPHSAHAHQMMMCVGTGSEKKKNNCCWGWRRRTREEGESSGGKKTTMPKTKAMMMAKASRSQHQTIPNHCCFFSTLFTTLFSIVIIQHRLNSVEAVRCYCTDEHCVPYGVCEAAVCLVGLLRANNAVIRTCGNEALGCQRNLDRWSHICSCEEHFCNTFLFLRASTNIDGAATVGGDRTPALKQQMNQDDRIFERVDPLPGEFATFDHPTDDDERTIKNSNLLTLLLVIVPLSVGAAAVVVVAINYYCHLC